MTFSDVVEGYWLARKRDFSPATVDQYSRVFTQFEAYLRTHGAPEFEAITANHVRGFLNDLADQELSKKSVANAWITLSSLWTWASQEMDVEHIIRGRVQRPNYNRQQPEPYTESEVRKMLDACDSTAEWRTLPGTFTQRSTAKRDRAIILVLLDTGLRASELCKLRVDDYDKKTGRLVVRQGKGGKQRSVYIGYTARQALWRYHQERMQRRREATGSNTIAGVEPLFPTSSNHPMARDNLLHLVQRIAQRAGVKNANLHRFRHTFAINFLRNGGNVYALQELLGHSDLETCRVYLKLVDKDLRAAIAAASPADTWRL